MTDTILLPTGYSVSVTYATVDNDPGDPEVGPQPDVTVGAVYWELRNSAMGYGVLACAWDSQANEWTVTACDGEPSDDPQEAIRLHFAEKGDPRDHGEADYHVTIEWLHEAGLI